jgi:GTP-binding protein
VPTGELNRFIHDLTTASPPITESKRRHVRVLYAAQPSVAPPTFVLFTNVSTRLHFSYTRFLENRLREKYDFFGTPIRIVVRGRASRSTESRPRSEGANHRRTSSGEPRANRPDR